jgi:hypothetical protein
MAGGRIGSRMERAPGMDACITMCLECHRVCLEAVDDSLRTGGVHAAPRHIGLLLDCAQMCATSADFLIRNSSLHGVTCGACAEVCDACAESCRQLSGPLMQRCAAICDRCAESCAEMAGGPDPETH